MKTAIHCIGIAGCLVLLAACDRDRTKPETTTVTGANVASISNDAAVRRLVEARCTREATCNNVGSDKRFTTRDACIQKVRTDMRDDLNAKDCPHGVDQKELNECVDAIQTESCNNPIEQVGRIVACRTSDLCLKMDQPNR